MFLVQCTFKHFLNFLVYFYYINNVGFYMRNVEMNERSVKVTSSNVTAASLECHASSLPRSPLTARRALSIAWLQIALPRESYEPASRRIILTNLSLTIIIYYRDIIVT